MKLAIFVVACIVIAATAAAAAITVKKRNGVNFLNGQWSGPKYDSDEAEQSMLEAQRTAGVNSIAITYCYYQHTVDSTGPIYPRPGVSPTKSQLSKIVERAKRNNITVLFRPCVDPDWSNPNTTGTWRGEIGRYFTPAQWNTWFNSSYGPFLLQQAALAQQLNVDYFSVGMELVAASKQNLHWRSLISQVRAIYTRGPITYCANHGNERQVEYWDVLDEISIDAYYTLAGNVENPTLAQLNAAWQPIVDNLAYLSAVYANKTVTFTEIGWCSISGTNNDPAHCYSLTNNPLNLTSQAVAYQAFYESVYVQPWFSGVYFWAWLSNTKDKGASNRGFTPHGKPAVFVMKQFGGANI